LILTFLPHPIRLAFCRRRERLQDAEKKNGEDGMSVLTRRQTIKGFAAAGIGGFAARPVAAGAAADFFAGKTLTVICGYNPGGGVDVGTRLIAKHIGRFIPGDVKVIVRNMQGASGLVAANHMYVRAQPDGLTLAVPGRNWILKPVLGVQNATFDPLKYGYIGSTGGTNSAAWIRADRGIVTPDQIKSARPNILFGGLVQSTLLAWGPKLLQEAGLPISVIMGYDNTSRVILAIEQKELDAIYTAETSLTRRHDLVDNKVIIPIFQSMPGMAGVPLIEDLVAETHRPLMKLVHGSAMFGMPLIAPPGTPEDRLQVLRAAFAEMTKDTAFQEEAKSVGEPYEAPLDGEQLAAVVRTLVESVTPSAAKALKELTGES
jgi:tripartite-type tricarboxylate transporter receptor subunit TctC